MLTLRISPSEKYLATAAQIDLNRRETCLTLRQFQNFNNNPQVVTVQQLHLDAFLYPLAVDDSYIVYMIGILDSPCRVEIRSTQSFELLHCILDDFYRLFHYSNGLFVSQNFTSPLISSFKKKLAMSLSSLFNFKYLCYFLLQRLGCEKLEMRWQTFPRR